MKDFEDDFFISLSSFVEELTELDYSIKESLNDENISQTIECIKMETSCQLLINVDENGAVQNRSNSTHVLSRNIYNAHFSYDKIKY